MNVLDLRGPDFLMFYLALIGIATVAAVALRFWLRGPGGEAPHFVANLDPYEVAYLSGGPRTVIDAAIASLVQADTLTVASGARLKTNGNLPPNAAPMERAVYDQIVGGDPTIGRLRRRARSLTDGIAGRLRAADLALMSGQAALARLLPFLLMLAVFAIGVTKVQVGISRNKPVTFLVILCLFTLVVAIQFAARAVFRTRAGDRILRTLRLRNAALQISVATASHRVAHTDVALALALFGPMILSSGPLLALRQALRPPSSGGSGCGGGSSCGGGGGCGGGGCGGCGGG